MKIRLKLIIFVAPVFLFFLAFSGQKTFAYLDEACKSNCLDLHSGDCDYCGLDLNCGQGCEAAIEALCIEQCTINLPAPTCTSAAPEYPSTTATSGTLYVYAYEVTGAYSVNFGVWGDTGGMDDFANYPGTNMGGGTWRGAVNLGAHKPGNPEYGNINVAVSMSNPDYTNTCGTANFTRNNLPPTAAISASPSAVSYGASGSITWSSTNATSCNITKDGAAFATGISGTKNTGPLTSNSNFALSCTGSGGTASASAGITVAPKVCASDVPASGAAPLSGYGWSSTIGWIQMNPACGGVYYNTTTGNLGGYAWSENVGWINFAPSGSYPSSPNYSGKIDFGTGQLSGWARAISADGNGWDGWFRLDGVTANLGTGTFAGYAWGSEVIGWVNFSGVTTGSIACPASGNNVTLSPASIAVGGASTASAPSGFSGGTFSSSNTSVATVSGSTVTGVALGSSNISGSNWTYTTNGATGCGLSAAILTVSASNLAPIAVATISKDGGTPAGSISVTQGVPALIQLFAEGSSDPNGWTDNQYGVSSGGGKCELNSDLNQGAPTFETVRNNPADPSDCNISLGNLTFNDSPGTYTYQILKITDKPGLVSNIAEVSVTVTAPACTTLSYQSGPSGFSTNANPVAGSDLPDSISVNSGDTFYIFVDYGQVVEAITAPVSGGYSCSWDSAWIGTAGRFKCTAPSPAGSYIYTTETIAGTSSNICASGPQSIGTVTVGTGIPAKTLSVSKSGTGSGTVNSSPAGINCGSTCSHTYSYSVLVTLTATPSSDSFFVSWSGCDVIAGSACEVNVNQPRSVTAVFDSYSNPTTPIIYDVSISSPLVKVDNLTPYTIHVEGRTTPAAGVANNISALIDYNPANPSDLRGYLYWDESTHFSDVRGNVPCSGGGYGHIHTGSGGSGNQNIHSLVSCSNVSADPPRVDFVVTFDSVFTNPVNDNFIVGAFSTVNGQSAGPTGGFPNSVFDLILAPPPPTNVMASNTSAGCEKIKLTWGDISGETGYKVYKDDVYQDAVGANVTEYVFNLGSDTGSHKYSVASTNNGVDSAPVTPPSPYDYISAIVCEANLNTSRKAMTYVNGAAYNSQTMTLKEGDTVDFKITLSNSGNIVAKLKKITDYFTNLTVPDDNFTNWARYCRDSNLTDCDYIPLSSITHSGTNKPNETVIINLTGGSYDIPATDNPSNPTLRYIAFKAKITAPLNFSGSNSRMQNSAIIEYERKSSEIGTRAVATPVLIFNIGTGAPNIYEVPN